MTKPYKYINLTYLEEITDGDRELIKELINIFIEQVPEFKDGFTEGILNSDWVKIAAVAHKAKSSVLSMGIENLGNNDLKNLELIAKQLRIIELDNEDGNEEEIEKLKRNFASYPSEKQDWITANSNIEKIKELIDRFNFTCTESLKELSVAQEN